MDMEGLKQRQPPSIPVPIPDLGAGVKEESRVDDDHPAGAIKHGGPKQLLRMCAFGAYFWSCCFTYVRCRCHINRMLTRPSISATQALGLPLYFINKDLYYAYMALTKQSFGLLIMTMTQWWSPTVVRVNGDDSISGQMRKTEDGRVELNFPERIVLMANHQVVHRPPACRWGRGTQLTFH